jgi:hypothetical protein
VSVTAQGGPLNRRLSPNVKGLSPWGDKSLLFSPRIHTDIGDHGSYSVVLYDQNCAPQQMLDGSNPVMSTDAPGNATMSFASHDPDRTMKSAQVQLFNTADWSRAPLNSPHVPLS